ncbi:hypothetical protein OG998_08880 [Streptomyces albidoflavus]|uniref:hypothetical protein n=1 Tax=Streptomyces albidoflavus TaxID=1886 RepID=UPI00332F95D4|nr:hypothetical protein OG998_08880 [Streptomyces albidoflavus]
MSEDRKLLEPLTSIVSIALRILLGALVAGFFLNLFVDGVFWGRGDTCVTMDWSGTSGGDFHPYEPLPGAGVDYTPRLCAEEPTTWQRVLSVARTAPTTVLLVGGLYLLDRLLRLAVREGVHTRGAAARLRVLGWWLLLGSLVVETAASVAGGLLLGTLTDDEVADAAWAQLWSAPYLAVLTGLGLLTFARIVGASALLRDELDAVV